METTMGVLVHKEIIIILLMLLLDETLHNILMVYLLFIVLLFIIHLLLLQLHLLVTLSLIWDCGPPSYLQIVL